MEGCRRMGGEGGWTVEVRAENQKETQKTDGVTSPGPP